MTGSELAELVADRLQEIVPSGFKVSHDRRMLLFSTVGSSSDRDLLSSGSYFEDTFELGREYSFEEGARLACQHALDDLQDFVDTTLVQPWPGRTKPPQAYVRVDAGVIQLWFGDGERHVLTCRDILYKI